MNGLVQAKVAGRSAPAAFSGAKNEETRRAVSLQGGELLEPRVIAPVSLWMVGERRGVCAEVL
jgi:hypothetical protein